MKNLRLFIDLNKASEEGAFRGGDPEELQFKKEEKLREQKESGEFEVQEEATLEQAEQADPGELEDLTEKENEKKADKEAMAASLSKNAASFPSLFSHSTGNQAVPVNTSSDYIPPDQNGNKRYPPEFQGKKQKKFPEGKFRTEENKNKIFSSEVLDFPPKGAPTGPNYFIQQIRNEDMRRRGVLPEEVSKGIDIIKAAYKLQGRTDFQGLKISIENKKGSTRKWYDPNNKESGSTKMHYDYGYIRNTKGVDGDHVDVYLGSNQDSEYAYVVHQNKAPEFKQYDEDKCMLGFDSPKEAKEAYIKQYDSPKFYGGMTKVPMNKFKEKVLATKNDPKMIKSK
jgi:hypothetical protein